MFVVQTRNVVTLRGDISNEIIKSSNDEWKSQGMDYDTFHNARANALKLIDYGTYKAENVRILEVVCTFESEVKIKEKIKGESSDN